MNAKAPAGFLQTRMRGIKILSVILMIAGDKQHRRRPPMVWGKALQAKVRILEQRVGLIGANVPSQHQKIGSRRTLRRPLGMGFKVQV